MKILITGASGLLGYSLRSHLERSELEDCVMSPTRHELNMSNDQSIREYIDRFEVFSPGTVLNCSSSIDTVYHLAAYVGGVKANSERLATFYSQNAQMGLNLLNACTQRRVRKVVSVLSTCVYPDTPYVTLPLTEDQLHMGPPHSSNFGYALSLIHI